jgi:hypothetical protein
MVSRDNEQRKSFVDSKKWLAEFADDLHIKSRGFSLHVYRYTGVHGYVRTIGNHEKQVPLLESLALSLTRFYPSSPKIA